MCAFLESEVARLEGEQRRLELVIDDLWGCIGGGEMKHLESSTVDACLDIHMRLYHQHD